MGRRKLTTYQTEAHRIGAAASARWRDRHPGAQRRAQDKWRKANPPDCAAVRAQDVAWCDANPIDYLFRGARSRAKRKGIPFTITTADIPVLPEFCPVLGLRLHYGASGKSRRLYENGSAASLDRVVNSRGYVSGNVIIVSLRANLLKGQATLEELQRIAAFYTRLQ